MSALYTQWRERLLALSEDVTGPMWVMLEKTYVDSSDLPLVLEDCDFTWPFAFDPEPLAQEVNQTLIPFRMDDPAARELREWWRGNLATHSHCFPSPAEETFSASGRLHPAQSTATLRRLGSPVT